jgi:hypothetical protein
LGNGASSAVWSKFAYKSLFAAACQSNVNSPLQTQDIALFKSLDTHNFETALRALDSAERTTRALQVVVPEISQRYASIRDALVEAVGAVHPPWEAVPLDVRQALGHHLWGYRSVYTTNYDLLLYWARMSVDVEDHFKDFFWGFDNEFDPADTEIEGGATQVFHLHGALHLYREAERTWKRVRQPGENLLEQFTQTIAGWSHPAVR